MMSQGCFLLWDFSVVKKIEATIQKQELLCIDEVAGPTGFAVFGASGDLAYRKLYPSLYELYSHPPLIYSPRKNLIAATSPTIKFLEESPMDLGRHSNICTIPLCLSLFLLCC